MGSLNDTVAAAIRDGHDGAVVELYVDPDSGRWGFDVRIPAPKDRP